MINKFIFLILILLVSTMVSAIEFVPQGNINGKGVYTIYNFTNISSPKFIGVEYSGNSYLQNGSLVLDTSNLAELVVNYSLFTNLSNMNVNTTTLKTTDGMLDVVFSYFTSQFYLRTLIDSAETTQNATISGINTSVFSELELRLNESDQRYNETLRIDAVNNTAVIANQTADKANHTANTAITRLDLLNDTYQLIGFQSSGVLNWSYLQNYPVACPTNSYITQLDDTITCTVQSTDTEYLNQDTYNISLNKTRLNQNTLNITSSYGNDTYVNINGDIMTGNLSAVNISVSGVFRGQPLRGMLGSGIIFSNQTNALSEVNITCVGLNCSYNYFEVRLQTASAGNQATYCKIPAGSKIVTDDNHVVLYVDINCAVQETTIDTWFNTLIGQGSDWDFANMVCYGGSCELSNGIGLEQRRMLKQRALNFNTNHLSVTNGYSKTTGTWPNWTLAYGEYIYLMDEVSTPTKVLGELEVIIPNGTDYFSSEQEKMNYTVCTNGTRPITCINTNRWRRIFFFMIGWNESDNDFSEVHQLLPSQTTTYSTEAQCLDVTTSPLVYTLPSWYNYAAAPLWAYCVRPSDTSWSATGWIDLRTVKAGGATAISTAEFVPYTGATQNVNFGSWNLTASWSNAYMNWSFLQAAPFNFTSYEYKLNISDQRYNDTTMIMTLNTSVFGELGIKLNSSDQRFNDTVLAMGINSSVFTELAFKLNASDQRFNDTTLAMGINTSVFAELTLKLNASDQRFNDTALTHVHNQGLNTTNDVTFKELSINKTAGASYANVLDMGASYTSLDVDLTDSGGDEWATLNINANGVPVITLDGDGGKISANDWTDVSIGASQVSTGTFGAGNYIMSTNLTVERIILETDTANHMVYDNSTCTIIKGDTATLAVC